MIKKAKVDNKIYDVVTFEEYTSNPTAYIPEFTAIEDEGMIYPIRRKTDTRAGMYPGTIACKFVHPVPEETDIYSSKNIIDFDKADSLKDIIEKQDKLRQAERGILTTVDNVFYPNITENDSPEMVGLKQAVIAKQIDLDKYEQRFGINYNNDKRLFNKPTITLAKLKTMFDVLDMKATLTIEDKNSDVPNPMNTKIVVDLTSDGDNKEEDTDESI